MPPSSDEQHHHFGTAVPSGGVHPINLPGHKGDAVWHMIRNAGAHLLLLPAYSPDLNPIEHVFSKFKTLLRKGEERTVDGLWKRIGQRISAFSKIECSNYFANSGYSST